MEWLRRLWRSKRAPRGVDLKQLEDAFRQELYSVNLRNLDLRGADMRNAVGFSSDFSGSNLAGANLTNAKLDRAGLSKTNLRGANLSGVQLYKADLRHADLSGADLSGADLTDAILSGTIWDSSTAKDAKITELEAQLEIITAARDLAIAERDARPTLAEVQDARLGSIVMAKDWQTGEITLCFDLQKTDDFTDWVAYGGGTLNDLGSGQFKVSLPLEPGKEWLRMVVKK